MFAVSETIEDGSVCVTSHPRNWNRDNLLLWPPEGSETFEEALEAEKMYSKHRDSDSFREENERKKFKRDHPMTANISGLVDMNDEIDNIIAENSSEATKKNDGEEKFSNQGTKYHKECFQKPSSLIPKKTVFSGLMKNPFAPLNQQLSKPEKTSRYPNYLKSGCSVPSTEKTPRYPNYLKSGSSVPSTEKTPRYPNYLKSGKKSTAPSSTITKKEYVRLNPIEEITDEVEVQVGKNGGLTKTSDKQKFLDTGSSGGKGPFTSSPVEQLTLHNSPFSRRYETESAKAEGFSSTHLETLSNDQNESAFAQSEYGNQSSSDRIGKTTSKPIILEDVLIKPGNTASTHRSSSFEDTVLSSLNELKAAQKKSEERQTLFEARMIVKYDTFVTDMQRAQGRPQSLGPKQNRELVQPDVHSTDSVAMAEENFEDLDAKFPVKTRPRSEQLEWAIRHELEFRFRLKSRLNDFIAKDPKKTIRLIMRYLISDKVLQQYTWNRTHEKQPFKQLTSINNFIFNIVQENFKKYKRTEYASYMGQWLKHAKSRQRQVTYTYPNPDIEMDEEEDDDQNRGDDNDELEW